MKIVINRCYGGFSLSPLAVQEIAKAQGRECYFFVTHAKDIMKHVPASLEEASKTFMFSAFDIPNPDEALRTDNFYELTLEERKASNEKYASHSLKDSDIDRTDPTLLEVVERLGKAANGRCADLEIIEIPDGVQWEIDEYDGMETVDEVHRSWG